MTISPLAGKPAPKQMLIDPVRLEREYFDTRPDPENPAQQVSFGTSGHRGSPLRRLVHRGAHPGDHPGNLRFPARRTAPTARCSWARTRMRYPAPPSARRWKFSPPTTSKPSSSGTTGSRRRRSSPGRSSSTIAAARAFRRRHRRHAVAQPAGGWRLQVQPAAWRAGRHRGDRLGRATGPTNCCAAATPR